MAGRAARARIHRFRDQQIADEPDRIQERGEENQIARHAIGQGKDLALLYALRNAGCHRFSF